MPQTPDTFWFRATDLQFRATFWHVFISCHGPEISCHTFVPHCISIGIQLHRGYSYWIVTLIIIDYHSRTSEIRATQFRATSWHVFISCHWHEILCHNFVPRATISCHPGYLDKDNWIASTPIGYWYYLLVTTLLGRHSFDSAVLCHRVARFKNVPLARNFRATISCHGPHFCATPYIYIKTIK